MGIDLRVGKNDRFVKYNLYKPNTKIHDKLSIDSNLIGRFYAKDITSYDSSTDDVNNLYKRSNQYAEISTSDIIEIEPNCLILDVNANKWYAIESVSEESINNSQQFSKRPIVEKRIRIRRGINL